MTLPPYARTLGVHIEPGDGAPVVVMPVREEVMGRPDFLHGGAIGGLLEIAAFAALEAALAGETRPRIKPVTVTIDFRRGGRPVETRASGTVTRLGNRIANVEAVAWQQDRDRPIATARMNVLLDRREDR